jgi:hypothetical protein
LYLTRSFSIHISTFKKALFSTLILTTLVSPGLHAKEGENPAVDGYQQQAQLYVQVAEERRRGLPKLTQTQLARLQRKNVEWKPDTGSNIQIEELVAQLDQHHEQVLSKYQNDPELFEQILIKRNITATNESGRATLVQLDLENGQKALIKLVSLNNSQGEAVDVIFADLSEISPDSLIFQKFIAHRMVYEPIDIAKTDFGRSLLLVDSDLSSVESTIEGLHYEDRNLFFPRGFNLKAWAKATFHKPSFKNVFKKESFINTAAQCGGALIACSLSDWLGVSSIPAHIPITLNLIYSTTISYFIDSYVVLNGEGSKIKRFAFNFTATSVSFAVALTAWAQGTDYLLHWEPWAWIMGNAFASNLMRAAIDNHSITKQEIGLLTKEKAKWNRQLFYSFVANPIRLIHLMAESFSTEGNRSSSDNTGGKAFIKSSYLILALMADWFTMHKAEQLAAKAKVDPEFAKRANISDSINRAAHLRKKFEERKAKFRDAPGKIVSMFTGKRVDDVDHTHVNNLFKSWMNAKNAYLYRLETSSEIPQAELHLYRAAFVEDVVDLAIQSIRVRNFSNRLASRSEIDTFVRTHGSQHRSIIMDKIERRYAWNANTEQSAAIHEYAEYVMQVSETMARKLNDKKNKNLTLDERSKLVGLVDDMVLNFEANAPKLGRQFIEVQVAEDFGINSTKAVEHFRSRITMWRFLYTKRMNLGIISQVPLQTQDEFIKLLNGEKLYELETWAKQNRHRYRHSGPVFQNEVSEIVSISRELKRRIDYKLAKFKLHEPINRSDLKKFKDELLAFHAIKDYQKNFAKRWPENIHPSTPPLPFWSYSSARGERNHEVLNKTFRPNCRMLLKVLGKPLI